jgi:hypothetical protein
MAEKAVLAFSEEGIGLGEGVGGVEKWVRERRNLGNNAMIPSKKAKKN